MYDQITYEVDEPVATITLNRPEALNAWTMRMAAEVRHAVYRAERDRSVVGIVITGAGRAFCAGADMNMLQGITRGEGDATAAEDGALDLTPPHPVPEDFDGEYTWLLAVSKPVIAAINGAVAGMAGPSRCAAICASWPPTLRCSQPSLSGG